MTKCIEELKTILEMASTVGKLQALNEMLRERVSQLESDMKRSKNEMKKMRNDMAEKDHRIEELEAKQMYEMTSENAEPSAQSPVVMVNNFYYLLSWPKTVEYVGSLDSNGRISAGHFIHHTLPDSINMNFVKRVDELTKLDAPQDKRLADAMVKVAERPTTQNIYGDKNEFNDDSKMVKMILPDDADPEEIAMRIAEQQKLLD